MAKVMDFLASDPVAQTLWANLIIWSIGAMVLLRAVRRSTFSMEISDRANGGEWRPDPLTEALTELRSAKAEIVGLNTEIESLDSKYVTRKEFAPVEKVVYGMVGLILSTALLSILVLIWRTK